MKKTFTKLTAFVAIAISVSSCMSVNKTMREPYTRVDFVKNDFNLSEQVTGQGTCTKVLGIDFYRWFHNSEMGAIASQEGMNLSLSSIPVVGNYLSDKTAGYAIYDMMNKTPGYDVVFYPQYEARVHRPVLGIGFIYKKTTVKATARLAKLK